MREVRVHGAANNLAADVAELLCPVAEGHNFSGAHKCKIQGVEKENYIFPCSTTGGNKNKVLILAE